MDNPDASNKNEIKEDSAKNEIKIHEEKKEAQKPEEKIENNKIENMPLNSTWTFWYASRKRKTIIYLIVIDLKKLQSLTLYKIFLNITYI